MTPAPVASSATPPRTCADCPSPIDRRSTRCKQCFMAHLGKDPAVRAKKAASLRRYMTDPQNRLVVSKRAVAGAHTRWSDPTYAEKTRRFFVEDVQPLSLTDPRAREWRRESALLTAEKRLAWCPVERRDEYRRMVRGGMKAARARQMIEASIAAEEKARIANLSPFERQERALRNGAGLVANVRVGR